MEVSARTTIGNLLDSYPFLLDYLLTLSPKFSKLKNPVLRKTLAKVASVSHAAEMSGLALDDLLIGIAGEIYRRSNSSVTLVNDGGKSTDEAPPSGGERVRVLKDIVLRLHGGEPLDAVRAEFHDLLRHVSPAEIGAMEQELVAGGIPETEIKRLCSLHVELFSSAVDESAVPEMPPGHPLHTLRAENAEAEARAAKLQTACESAVDDLNFTVARQGLLAEVNDLAALIRHYERKENQLFPIMEEHGLTAPPQVMWEIHDEIRAMFKKAAAALKDGGREAAVAAVVGLVLAVRDMVFKEERILLPMVYEIFSEQDWSRVRHGEEEIGYAWVTPGDAWQPQALTHGAGKAPLSGEIALDAGKLRAETVNALLKTLPVDLTFVGADDRVAYFSQTEERIFPRSAGIIGREVSKCHPPKSVHMVEAILSRFRSGERNVAEFWLELGGKFIHIRYFPVRSASGEYLGCLEVSQDVTSIRALQGQQRLLDWA